MDRGAREALAPHCKVASKGARASRGDSATWNDHQSTGERPATGVFGSWSATPAIEPVLEHDDRPEPPCVVGGAAPVLVEQAVDASRSDPPFGIEAPRVQHAVDVHPQAAVDPRGDRHAEAALP